MARVCKLMIASMSSASKEQSTTCPRMRRRYAKSRTRTQPPLTFTPSHGALPHVPTLVHLNACVRVALPQVLTVQDIQTVVAFASFHHITVSIKTSGHSYSASSMVRGSLLIWMAHLTKYGSVDTHVNSCGTATPHVLKIGGGAPWGDAYNFARAAGRELIGGSCATVGAAGGWLAAGGLSALSRKHGCACVMAEPR